MRRLLHAADKCDIHARNQNHSALGRRGERSVGWRLACETMSSSSSAPPTPDTKQIVVGVCAMEKKAESRPMQEMLKRLREYFDVFVFTKEILKGSIDQWPRLDVLIPIYSDGFPLDKVRSYIREQKPKLVINDLDMQEVLLDRTKVYRMLVEAGIDVPRHAVASTNPQEGSKLVEEDDQITIAGQVFKKPFVEKPVSAENHNIVVYYPTSAGGGSRHLFRKTKDSSSEFSTNGKVRRDGEYLYEEFVPTNATDVKVYAVGPDNAYAEARKAPSLDGKVERNELGKETRYPVALTLQEKDIARRVVEKFRQTVCGFDLLRSSQDGKSYVCDVNGFSFVKQSTKYYEHAAKILRAMIVQAVRERRAVGLPTEPAMEVKPSLVSTTKGTDMELRCVLAVIRHGDRTPKQKLKMTVSHDSWKQMFEKNRREGTNEAKLKTPEQLQNVLDNVRRLLGQEKVIADETVKSNLTQLKSVLEMYGSFSGINRKVQLKRKGDKSANIELVAKWGGELTTAGEIQAEAMGKRFRQLYPGGKSDSSGCGFLRLHNTYRHDLKVYASDEGRVQMTAAAFTKGLLAMDAELAAMLVHMVNTVNTGTLLADDKGTKEQRAKSKERLKQFFETDRQIGEQEMAQLNPSQLESMNKALHLLGNPYKQCQKVWELASKLCDEIDRKCKDPRVKDQKLNQDETWDLVGHRWRKLVREFQQQENGRVVYEVGKIQEMYDNIKYDVERNVRFFRANDISELYDKAKLLADIVVPLEYGIENDEKLAIGRGTCTPLMKKLLGDLKACVNVADDGSVTRLDAEASEGIESPTRRVRTRLYFTSKSHLHSLVNVVRYGDLLEAEDEQWKRALDFLSQVWEYNYLAQVVILLFENKAMDPNSDERFHAELHFSPGVQSYKDVEQLAEEMAKNEDRMQKERLISTDIIEGERLVSAPLRTTAVVGTKSSTQLWTASGAPGKDQITSYLPPLHSLTTLSNRLTCRKFVEFFERMTKSSPK